MKLKYLLIICMLLFIPYSYAALDILEPIDPIKISSSSITIETKKDYLDIPDKERYEFDGEKLTTYCKDCKFTMNVCNVDGVFDLGMNVYYNSFDSINQIISDVVYSWNYMHQYKNGSYESVYQSGSIKDFSLYIESLSLGSCDDIIMNFRLFDEAVDIIPVVNGVSYDEYAWFIPFENEVSGGGFYCSFQNYTHEGEGVTTNESSDCNWIGTSENRTDVLNIFSHQVGAGDPAYRSFSNESVAAPYVNDTADATYGCLGGSKIPYTGDINTSTIDTTHTIYINNTNLSFCIDSSTDFYVSLWYSINETSPLGNPIFRIADKDGAYTRNDELSLTLTAGDKFGFTAQDYGYSYSSGNRLQLVGATTVVVGEKYHVLIYYNNTANMGYLYVNNVLDATHSVSISDICFDGTSNTYEYIFKELSDPGWGSYDTTIDEFIISANTIDLEGRTYLYNIQNHSSLVYNSNDVTNVSVIEGSEYMYQYNFTDAIDSITYYQNSTQGNISVDGVFRFQSGTIGTYDITINGTDGFDNWAEDQITITVTEGVVINDSCDNTTITHNQNFSCTATASFTGIGSITWSINDTRLDIFGNDSEAYITDDPSGTDYNIPDCWDVNVTASASGSSDSFNFMYCINDSAPIVTSYFFGLPFAVGATARTKFTISDVESESINVNITWLVNSIEQQSSVSSYSVGSEHTILFDLSTYLATDLLQNVITVYDDNFQDTYTLNTTITEKTDGSINFGICPSLDAEFSYIKIVIVFIILFIVLGIYIGEGIFLLFSGLGTSFIGFYIYSCSNLLSIIIVGMGLMIMYVGFNGIYNK